ncbi:hypothetical protein CO009_01795 [Candidatus Shapirobacteria bacterium CG_4_8_14_3_um_filter_35_11]|uniref:Uncharacterized protein n=6 Tax=Candidatus Shapironibacteriota TaxID=1752721 RepID=A0A1J5HRW1_9BACT|nr:MAG: hypothetical protein AUK05_01095 [Candidatus Shapirobacteria bacterium CG2_30_35_20]PIV07855.1 MAG: hypothetical protein COS53_00225 [Candidatus Shapirobacteria bacterium CG03_land_8_20_14_0_80_35_14]PIX67980.1 MAG: hypothetical protein COZ41_02185 [Candidatus Shapirobacteria bacterium CG_4_10_14_3_um_filter_35_13]PJA51144.1 MAG: hypothetical protein CO168_01390 [Candidatus Shapirobacteria bacterium CG_4_9_14_3_um_filter_36_12]PJC80510.1 MAG: hypothetical protein CO009_01795 [Candidatus
MKLEKNIRTSIIITLIAIILFFAKAGIFSGIFSIIGLVFAKKSLKNSQHWAAVLGVINLTIIAYYLFFIFVIGYAMTNR